MAIIIPPSRVASPLVLGLLSKAAEIIYLKSGDIYRT
jgi:hypothetical protein